MEYTNQQTAVSRQRIVKHAYNNRGTVRSGVFCPSRGYITRFPGQLKGELRRNRMVVSAVDFGKGG
jgi:hypothetical protein